MKLRLSVLALAALTACTPRHVPVPAPLPTAPPPVVQGPLVAGPDGKWTRDGNPFVMRLVVVCCAGPGPGDLAKDHAWPLIDEDFINWIAFHGQNATHVRMGPHSPRHEASSLYSAYKDSGDGRVDLTQWNPEFFAYTDRVIKYAATKGVIVEVDFTDYWVLQHRLSPWCPDLNINGVDVCGEEALKSGRRPPEIVLAFVRKIVEELGDNPNVLFQDGNEAWKGMSTTWSLAVRDEARAVETAKGYVRHPFGTNSDDDGTKAQVDYVTYHGSSARPVWNGKPTHVNEYDTASIRDVVRQAYRAEAMGSAFGLWMGDMSEAERGATLIHLEGLAKGLPNPFPTAATCPPIAGIDVKVHQHVCQNQTVGVPCVGGSTVIDSTPNFGRRGPRGVCNSEHDNCEGRICEPPDGLAWEWEAPPGVRCVVQNEGECNGQCTTVPCKAGRGYQLRCENLRSGHYRAQPFIRNGVDCEGKSLRPGVAAGDVVEWHVP